MSKTFLIKGEVVEFTDEELMEYLFKDEPEDKGVPLDLVDSIINSAIASTLAFGRAEINTAKDSREIQNACKMLSDTLNQAVKYRISEYIDQLIMERLELAPKTTEGGEDA